MFNLDIGSQWILFMYIVLGIDTIIFLYQPEYP